MVGLGGRKTLTFLAKTHAREGYTFLYEGKAAVCDSCRYSAVCHSNVRGGSLYQVVKVRDKTINCPLVGETQLVEVSEAGVKVAVGVEGAHDGALMVFAPQPCSNLSCDRFDICVPTTLRGGVRCRIVEVGDVFRCPMSGRSLQGVSVLPVSEA